jgi:5-methylcytosine-specific restriction endonuclease McrA
MPKITQAQEYMWKPAMIEYNYCCGGCGSPLDLEYDHIVPRCKGGSDHVSNIQILCHHCNQHKGKVCFPKVPPRMHELSIPQIHRNRQEFVLAVRNWKKTIAS